MIRQTLEGNRAGNSGRRPGGRGVLSPDAIRGLERRDYPWQGGFASFVTFVMDEPYLLAAGRCVQLNPVRANLVADAAEWPFSSANAHLPGRDCLRSGLRRVRCCSVKALRRFDKGHGSASGAEG